MKKIVLYVIAIAFCLTTACKEDFVGQPGVDNVAPGSISNPVVENLPGGAKISYELPADADLLYVKAIYTLNGIEKNTSATLYENFITIEGYGSTDAQKVKLYCIDRSGNASKPVEVTIHPTTPPIQLMFETFKMQRTFGGINLEWENKEESDVAIYFLAADSTGTMQEVEVLYTGAAEGKFSLRGFDSQERRFGVFVRDRWDNYSDTLYGTFSPLYEKEVSKEQWDRINFPGDNTTENGGAFLWRFIKDGINGDLYHCWHTLYGMDPMYFTIDLGESVKLSRYKLWHRMYYEYNHHNPKKWEIWGTNEPKMESDLEYWTGETGGYRDDWTLLMSCYSFKPSGENSPNTQDDITYARAGFEFEFPLDAPAVRYLRFHILETWGGGRMIHISELSFWGAGEE